MRGGLKTTALPEVFYNASRGRCSYKYHFRYCGSFDILRSTGVSKIFQVIKLDRNTKHGQLAGK